MNDKQLDFEKNNVNIKSRNPAYYSQVFKNGYYNGDVLNRETQDTLSEILKFLYQNSNNKRNLPKDFESVMNRVIKFNIEKLKINSSEFKYYIENNIPVNIIGDCLLFEDIINNLIDFVIKHYFCKKVTFFVDYTYISHNSINLYISLTMRYKDNIKNKPLNLDTIKTSEDCDSIRLVENILIQNGSILNISSPKLNEIKFDFNLFYNLSDNNNIPDTQDISDNNKLRENRQSYYKNENILNKSKESNSYKFYLLTSNFSLRELVYQQLDSNKHKVTVLDSLDNLKNILKNDYDAIIIEEKIVLDNKRFFKNIIKKNNRIIILSDTTNCYFGQNCPFKTNCIFSYPLNIKSFFELLEELKKNSEDKKTKTPQKIKPKFYDKDALSKTLNIFKNEYPLILSKIKECIERQDYKLLIFNSIYLKEIVSIFRYQKLIDILYKLEKMSIEKKSNKLNHIYFELESEIINLFIDFDKKISY